jgi:anti-sigma B factor antagonist
VLVRKGSAVNEKASLTVTIELSGEFDIGRTAELRDTVLFALTGDETVVVVDLRDVSFMDSAALRSLLEVRSVIAERGARLRLVNPQPRIAKLFAVTNTLELFGLHD